MEWVLELTWVLQTQLWLSLRGGEPTIIVNAEETAQLLRRWLPC